MDLLHVSDRLFGGPHVGLGDDLEERRAGAIQIDAARVRKTLVKGLSRILLEVRPRDPDRLCGAVIEHDADRSVADDRMLVLADLIALRQVGIEIILAREDRPRCDLRIDGEAEFDRHAQRLAIEHRERPRIGEIHQIRLRVGRRTVCRGRAREYLRARRQLRMDFETDDDFPVTHYSYPRGRLRCQSVARWY